MLSAGMPELNHEKDIEFLADGTYHMVSKMP
jgi:hypothetical protein